MWQPGGGGAPGRQTPLDTLCHDLVNCVEPSPQQPEDVPKLDWYYKREVYKREVGLGGRLGTAREFIAVGW
jgi:hypothetical protein